MIKFNRNIITESKIIFKISKKKMVILIKNYKIIRIITIFQGEKLVFKNGKILIINRTQFLILKMKVKIKIRLANYQKLIFSNKKIKKEIIKNQ